MWSTGNSRLAAALIALGFKLDTPELTNTDAGAVINFIHDDELLRLSRAWTDDRFEIEQPQHPLTHMRKVSKSYEWMVNKVLYGNYAGDPAMETRGAFVTYELRIACMLIADNYYLSHVERSQGRFHFCQSAREVAEKCKSASAPHPLFYMRAYLEEHDKLKSKIKHSRLDTVRRVKQTVAHT